MAWTPLDNTVLPVAWLDADAESGANLATWTDRSGNGNDATSSDTTDPAITQKNGRNWIDFAGGGYFTMPNLTTNQPDHAIFVVFEVAGDNERLLDSRGTGAIGANDGYQFKARNSGGEVILVEDSGGRHYGHGVYDIAGDNLVCAIFKASNYFVVRYGGQEFEGPTIYKSATFPEALSNSDAIHIGAVVGGGSTQKFTGKIAELIVYPGAVSLEELMKIEGYLAHKWGLQGQLYDLHPYKESPPADPNAGQAQSAKVSGIVQVDSSPAQRQVRAYGYNPIVHDIDGSTVTLSKSLGHATSDPNTGEYTIDLLGGYGNQIFVVAFDDYGDEFTPDKAISVGERIHPSEPNGYVFECTGSGTLPSEEPTWITDTETSQLYGTASMIARVFYRPMVHGPVAPEVTIVTSDDPYFSSVTLLLHMDGVVGATTFTDSSATPKTLSVTGEAQIGDGGKFEQGLLLDGSGDSLIVGDGTIFGDADFTIEAWIFATSASTTNEIFASNNDTQYDLVFEVTTDWRLRAQIRNAANSSEVNIELNSSTGVIALSTWHHVALTAEGTTAKLWADGVEMASGAIGGTRGATLVGAQIGQLRNARWFAGLIDEVRVTKGIARYTEAFTPPTQPFPNTAPTTTETTARYVRFFVGEAQDNTKEPCITEVWIEAPDGTKVLTKTETVTSSSDFSSSYPAAAVIDGSVDSLIASDQTDASDRWVAGGKLDQWVSVDLGEVKSIAKAHVLGIVYASSTNLPRAPKVFSIELSDDGTNWTSAYSNTAESPWTESEIRTYDLTAS